MQLLFWPGKITIRFYFDGQICVKADELKSRFGQDDDDDDATVDSTLELIFLHRIRDTLR